MIGIIMACLLLANSISAQHSNLGVKAGLNVYNINSTAPANTDYKAGLHAGLLSHIHLSRDFALQPEVMYSLQGTSWGNNSLNLGYINVPVLVQYMFGGGFRVQAGPQIGILAHANSKVNGNNTQIRDNYKTLEAAVSIGTSYVHLPSGLGADLRYNHGLTDITKTDMVTTTNRGFQLGIFYLFVHQ